jgi:hypothetical protein
MKKICTKISVFFTVFLFFSCSSPMSLTDSSTLNKSNVYGDEFMEFIGFKNSLNLNNVQPLLGNFGGVLSNTHIAIDKSNFYLGIYSFEELEKYKSTKRYITFVEIVEHSFTYKLDDKPWGLWSAGVWLTCFGILPIGVPMWIIADSKENNTTMTLHAKYNIYVYDTEKKEIINTTTFLYDKSDRYKGKYSHNKTDRNAITKYYSNFLINALEEKYADVYHFVQNLNSKK